MLLSNSPYIDKVKIERALKAASDTISRNIIKFQDHFPSDYSYDGVYKYANNIEAVDWKSGFWNGLVWLLYEYNKLTPIRCYGEKITDDLCALFEKNGLLCSDLGFLMMPSCVANYHFTNSRISKETIITAADSLLTKYHNTTSIICSFDEELEEDYLSCKISNLLNIQLLMCAYKITDNIKYITIAEENTKLIIKHNIEENGKTYFRAFFDRSSGKFINRKLITTNPRINDSGYNSRNYAWALYGLSILYHTSRDSFYHNMFCKVFDFWEKLNTSSFVYVSLGHEHEMIYDNMSAAIIVSSLCTICKTDIPEKERYIKKASEILNTLIDNFIPQSSQLYEGLITVYFDANIDSSKPHCSLMCDYFYYEALMNSSYNRDSFWYETK